MTEKKRLRTAGRILLSITGLLGILVLGFIIWGSSPARPIPEALAALQSDADVSVAAGKWLTFQPVSIKPTTGLIIYPGGHVDYRAYAPAAYAIAAQGYLVVIAKMPLNLAVFDPGAAAGVISAHPEIQRWAIGGHSLGGAMAANFVYTHPDSVDGLVLWAAYPAEGNNLSDTEIQVLSISGTLDGLSTPGKISTSRTLLPPGTNWVLIKGGNHAQFGWYGTQSGDNIATASREEQQAQIIKATLTFLKSLE